MPARQPSPPYAQRDTAGWVSKSKQFLVPEGALTLVLMPSLFQVQAGTLDLDDLVLKPGFRRSQEMQRLLSEIHNAKTNDALGAVVEGLRATIGELGRPKTRRLIRDPNTGKAEGMVEE